MKLSKEIISKVNFIQKLKEHNLTNEKDLINISYINFYKLNFTQSETRLFNELLQYLKENKNNNIYTFIFNNGKEDNENGNENEKK